MKKNLKVFLCLLLVLAMIFSFVACDPQTVDPDPDPTPTPTPSDGPVTPTETIDDAKSALLKNVVSTASGAIRNFEANLTVDDGETTIAAVVNGTKDALNVVNADVILTSDYRNEVMLIRDNNIYYAYIESDAEEIDKAAVKEYLDENPNVFSKAETDGDTADTLSQVVSALSAAKIMYGTMIDTLARNMLSVVFNDGEITENGYVLSVDFEKLTTDLWNNVYALAELIDSDNDITVAELYASDEVQAFVAPLLEDLTGQQVADLLNMAKVMLTSMTDEDTTIAFTVLSANDSETANEYIQRTLENLEISVTSGNDQATYTIGEMKFSDIYATLSAVLEQYLGTDESAETEETDDTAPIPDLTDLLDSVEENYKAAIAMVTTFKAEMVFDSDKNLTDINLDIVIDLSSAETTADDTETGGDAEIDEDTENGEEAESKEIHITLDCVISDTEADLLDVSDYKYLNIEYTASSVVLTNNTELFYIESDGTKTYYDLSKLSGEASGIFFSDGDISAYYYITDVSDSDSLLYDVLRIQTAYNASTKEFAVYTYSYNLAQSATMVATATGTVAEDGMSFEFETTITVYADDDADGEHDETETTVLFQMVITSEGLQEYLSIE